MKYFLLGLLLSSFLDCKAQPPHFIIHNLSLPEEIAFYDNKFSSLYVHNEKLFLMSESRLEDGAEGKLYAINLADLDRKMKDTAYPLPYKKYHLYNLEILRDNIDAAGQSYEGLEAMIIDNDTVYLSVETATPATNCYLLRGILNDTSVIMDTHFLVPVAKPGNANGSHIYNAGFEAMYKRRDSIFSLFEYNYFPKHNYVYTFKNRLLPNDSIAHIISIDKLPFRITDITSNGDHFTAINYFFKGEGGDTIYRMPNTDTANNKLIKNNGVYKNYCRLIDITYNNNRFAWKLLWEFPAPYNSYNWEGIAAYKHGYFIINDKYTPARPYRSTLLYLERK